MQSDQPAPVKGACLHCAGHFLFEPQDAGRVVACPHCGQQTPLFGLKISFDDLPAAQPTTPSSPSAPPAAGAQEPSSDGPALAHYVTGNDVRPGDRVRHGENYATVVFVSNGEAEACARGYEDYLGHDAGIIICDDDGETSFLRDDDLRLEFLHR